MSSLSLKKQQGVVIVIALFIVAFVATMAYVMMARLSRDTERTTLILRATTAESYAEGSILWAMDTLEADWEQQKPNQLIDRFPIESPILKVNGYEIHSVIYDLQGRFNINNIANNDIDAINDLTRLLQLADPKLDDKAAMPIIQAIMVWVTPNAPSSALNEYYFSLSHSYRNANRRMQSITELHLVRGITSELYTTISPWLTALPENTKINVQTASAPVLMLVNKSLTLEAANQIIKYREGSPFITVEDFINSPLAKNHGIMGDKITTISNYFLVETTVKIENQQTLIYTLLMRTTNGKKATITVLSQSKGAE